MDKLIQAWAYAKSARRVHKLHARQYRYRWAYARILEAAAPVVLYAEQRGEDPLPLLLIASGGVS